MIKLSDAQTVALNEISQGVFKARKNTLTSLEKAGLIEPGESLGVQYVLTDAGREAIGLPSQEEFAQAVDKLNESFVQALEVEDLKVSPAVTLKPEIPGEYQWIVDAAEKADTDRADALVNNVEVIEPKRYDFPMADWEIDILGLPEWLKGWKGTEVWNGLTLAEIKDDIKTATPVGRQARRVHYRTLKNAFRRMNVLRPRKALKITGAVGL